MNIEEAIVELSALLKHQSDGYYIYLVNGGKNDPNMEKSLDALDFAIKFMRNNTYTERGG